MKIHVGASGYGYKEWKGVFYPAKTSAGDMLRFYSGRFDTVEINNTFYRMPTERLLESWAGQVPEGFIFALKAPQVITHIKRLKNVESEIMYLLRTVSVLLGRLGPILFQFPATFRPDRRLLEDFLGLLPNAMSIAFEFRNPSRLDEGVLNLLRTEGRSLCTGDSEENPATEIISTAPWGYLRLRRSDYTDAELARWRDKIIAQNWEKAFVFFKHEGEAGPEMALRFRELVKKGG